MPGKKLSIIWSVCLLLVVSALAACSSSGSDLSPRILSFKASRLQTTPGQGVTLTWETSLASRISVTPPGTDVTLEDYLIVSPLETTTYTLRAENDVGGKTEAILTVTVAAPPPEGCLGDPLALPGSLTVETTDPDLAINGADGLVLVLGRVENLDFLEFDALYLGADGKISRLRRLTLYTASHVWTETSQIPAGDTPLFGAALETVNFNGEQITASDYTPPAVIEGTLTMDHAASPNDLAAASGSAALVFEDESTLNVAFAAPLYEGDEWKLWDVLIDLGRPLNVDGGDAEAGCGFLGGTLTFASTNLTEPPTSSNLGAFAAPNIYLSSDARLFLAGFIEASPQHEMFSVEALVYGGSPILSLEPGEYGSEWLRGFVVNLPDGTVLDYEADALSIFSLTITTGPPRASGKFVFTPSAAGSPTYSGAFEGVEIGPDGPETAMWRVGDRAIDAGLKGF